MESTSFISIKKAALVELCNKCIARIEQKRKEKETKYIYEQINYQDSWFNWLLGRKRMNFEEMKAQIEREIKSGGDNLFAHLGDYPSIYAWKSLDIAEKLLKSCNQVEDDGIILLSVEDFNYIS